MTSTQPKEIDVYTVVIPGQHRIRVTQQGEWYTVRYGHSTKNFSNLLLAVAEAESCTVHALTCNGELD